MYLLLDFSFNFLVNFNKKRTERHSSPGATVKVTGSSNCLSLHPTFYPIVYNVIVKLLVVVQLNKFCVISSQTGRLSNKCTFIDSFIQDIHFIHPFCLKALGEMRKRDKERLRHFLMVNYSFIPYQDWLLVTDYN